MLKGYISHAALGGRLKHKLLLNDLLKRFVRGVHSWQCICVVTICIASYAVIFCHSMVGHFIVLPPYYIAGHINGDREQEMCGEYRRSQRPPVCTASPPHATLLWVTWPLVFDHMTQCAAVPWLVVLDQVLPHVCFVMWHLVLDYMTVMCFIAPTIAQELVLEVLQALMSDTKIVKESILKGQ